MGLISHRWPGISPFNVEQLPAHWWAYYVRLAQAYEKAMKEARRSVR